MKMTLAPEEKYRKIKQSKRNVIQRAFFWCPGFPIQPIRDLRNGGFMLE
jgi:hypothetical protein